MSEQNNRESDEPVTQTLEIRDSLNEVNAASWNALTTDNNPFVQYEFLHGLQASDCLGADKGWYPLYFLLWSEPSADNEEPALLAAMATYVKTHSYGEFVFDWAWADAYQRSNLDYYPKLICAVPYTPATGPRILVRADQPFQATAQLLARGACQYAQEQNFSSVHWLFTRPEECQALCGTTERSLPSAIATGENSDDTTAKTGDPTTENESSLGLLQRIDVQYHWRNEGYQSFDDFLAQCTAKRRKTLRRERRYVTDAGLRIERRSGDTLTAQEWRWVHEFYCATFDRKWGSPSLSEAFFLRMGETFGTRVLIVFAYDPSDTQPEHPVACSIMFQGGNRLFGRFWGCRREYHCLHFEACYYQGIEHCIANGITHFEPGAQGEHKITRGFIPTYTESAHYIVHPDFRNAIKRYLDEEKKHVRDRCAGLADLLPFKHDILTPTPHADSVHST